MLWANKMICGFCGTEQNYSNKPCRCGAALHSTTTSHWEGGKGCRDKARMSTKDSKKYANAAKTQAVAKVGKKAKELREARRDPFSKKQ